MLRGYPFPEQTPSGGVRRLEDTDGDGSYDKSTVFVDGLSWPTSVLPYDGGVFIAAAPDILHAKDNDGCTKEAAIELLRKNSAAAAAAIRGLSDAELDSAAPASLYEDAPITCQFMLEDHAVRHSYHHLALIRAALKK